MGTVLDIFNVTIPFLVFERGGGSREAKDQSTDSGLPH